MKSLSIIIPVFNEAESLPALFNELKNEFGNSSNVQIVFVNDGSTDNSQKIIEKAKTIFKVLDKNSNSSLVEMKPITGRKHQLRKQLFNIGHSIYGDKKYRSSLSTKGINKELMLHSYQIKFMINKVKHTYTALLPDYFKKLLKAKRLNFSNLT